MIRISQAFEQFSDIYERNGKQRYDNIIKSRKIQAYLNTKHIKRNNMRKIFSNGKTDECVCRDNDFCLRMNLHITRLSIFTLKGQTWLNDEVITFYLKILQDHDDHLCEQDTSRKSSFFYITFFFTKWMSEGYAGVRRLYMYTYIYIFFIHYERIMCFLFFTDGIKKEIYLQKNIYLYRSMIRTYIGRLQ
jgi:Ulp1 family protease